MPASTAEALCCGHLGCTARVYFSTQRQHRLDMFCSLCRATFVVGLPDDGVHLYFICPAMPTALLPSAAARRGHHGASERNPPMPALRA